MHEVWLDVWPDIGPLIDRAMTGETVALEDLHLVMTRKGYEEDTRGSFSYSPLRDDNGAVVGILDVAVDTTRKFFDAQKIATGAETIRAWRRSDRADGRPHVYRSWLSLLPRRLNPERAGDRSRSLWQATQVRTPGSASRRRSGIGSPHSSQCSALSPAGMRDRAKETAFFTVSSI
jgi:hypothetical protein